MPRRFTTRLEPVEPTGSRPTLRATVRRRVVLVAGRQPQRSRQPRVGDRLLSVLDQGRVDTAGAGLDHALAVEHASQVVEPVTGARWWAQLGSNQ
jgi:hypothetical protein